MFDVRQRLVETNEAIQVLAINEIPIPPEAIEIQWMLERIIDLEAALDVQNQNQQPASTATEPPTTLWLVGQILPSDSSPTEPEAEAYPWAFQGIFSSKEAAISACRTVDYFMGPVELNKSLDHNIEAWEGCYYPIGPLEPSL